MTVTQELDDREFDAFAKHYRTPARDIEVIKKYFALVADGENGEHFECRYCRRRFSVVEVFTIIDPMILTEHPSTGMPTTMTPFGTDYYYKHQCAIEDPK